MNMISNSAQYTKKHEHSIGPKEQRLKNKDEKKMKKIKEENKRRRSCWASKRLVLKTTKFISTTGEAGCLRTTRTPKRKRTKKRKKERKERVLVYLHTDPRR